MVNKPAHKKDWILGGEAFEKLLACLDSDSEEAGRKLLGIRRRLQKFFEYNRCLDSDSLVDITIDRCARRLDEGVEVEDINHYISQIARYVLQEQWATKKNFDEFDEGKLDVSTTFSAEDQDEDEKQEHEARLVCLEKCADKLPAVERQRIIDYYYEQRRAKIDNRKRMAKELNITQGNLRVKMHRTREKLEKCILDCLNEKKQI